TATVPRVAASAVARRTWRAGTAQLPGAATHVSYSRSRPPAFAGGTTKTAEDERGRSGVFSVGNATRQPGVQPKYQQKPAGAMPLCRTFAHAMFDVVETRMIQPAWILIVEDNRTVARDLEQRLGRLGFAIAGVTGLGEEAIVLAEDERPDLVLMDIRLGAAMDGITAAEYIRARLGVPVVFLTMFADDATLRAASVSEAFGYIIKPAQDRELRIVIEMALYKHAAERDRRRLEEQLRRSEKMEAIGQLAGGIAHDFNNILMAILSNCRSLIEQLPRDEKPYQQVSQIRSSAERAARLTRQLLAFGRDEQDQPVPLDLAAHIQRTAGMLAEVISDDIKVELEIEHDLRAVLGRSSEIEQVIMNLLVNARDAMPRGGTVTVAAHNVPDSEEILLTVSDTGEGMDEVTRGRVFEPFFTTKEVGAGTGLGLATVYAVVARSRGRIEVASELGKGATFSIWLQGTTAPPVEPRDVVDDLGPQLE